MSQKEVHFLRETGSLLLSCKARRYVLYLFNIPWNLSEVLLEG